jgi:threonine dehydrogenase-like Zn-dependent dehydrogenase
VKPGDVVAAVVGDGAVGLCAIIAAKRLGATDIVEERGEDAVAVIMMLTDGIGVDAALECFGTDQSIETCVGIARAGGMTGAAGVPTYKNFKYQSIFWKNVGIRGGVAPARQYIPELLEDVLAGKINPGLVFDLIVELKDVKQAYVAMDERCAIKSLLKVSEV